MNYLALCLILSNTSYLDDKPIYANPLANIRSPELGLSVNTAKYLGSRIYYLEGIIGRTISVITYENDKNHLQLQLSAEVSTWVMLGYAEGAFPLLTQDFYFSIPLFFTKGNLSGGIKFNHISAHKGDGLDSLAEEALSEEERANLESIEKLTSLDVSVVDSNSYSRDFLSFHFAYEYNIKKLFKVKSYFHGGYIHKSSPDLKRLFFGHSFDLIYGTSSSPPYYAYDVTYNQDVDSVDYSSQLGIMFFSSEGKFYEARLALTGYIGSDRRGQFLGRKLKQFGIGIFIR
jgi:hypothetical protein